MYREWPFQRIPLPPVLAWMKDSKSRSAEGMIEDRALTKFLGQIPKPTGHHHLSPGSPLLLLSLQLEPSLTPPCFTCLVPGTSWALQLLLASGDSIQCTQYIPNTPCWSKPLLVLGMCLLGSRILQMCSPDMAVSLS